MLWIYLLSGFILLLVGGEVLVKGSVAVAHKMQVPSLVIGIVLVGLGTSMPELVTCIEAVMKGVPDIAVGNVVGSNIANILLVAGASAIFYPIITPLAEFKRDGGAVALSTLLLITIAFTLGQIGMIIGIFFVVLLFSYIGYTYFSEKITAKYLKDVEKEIEEIETVGDKEISVLFGILLTFGGIGLTVLGAKLLVSGAIIVAKNFGISEAVIGLTIVAIGTSLPELATAIIAGVRGHSDLSLGNILGSNVYNILGILGVTAIVEPLHIPKEILSFDIWVMLGATIMLIIVAITKLKITRLEGGVLMATYAIYLYMLYLNTQTTI